MLHRMLAKLLDYPDARLPAAAWEIRERARLSEGLSPAERRTLAEFMDFVESRPLTELQAHYVMTFDLTPEHSLHLTHHLFGDDKNRGPALIDLAEYYKACGLELPVKDAAAADDAVNELPDYLPLMLEFCSQLEEEEARLFLSRWGKVLAQLAANLEEAGSPYAALVRLVEQRSQLVMAAA